jgi:hypothetical protein
LHAEENPMRRLNRHRSARRLAFERIEPRTMFAATTTNDFGWSDAFAPSAGHLQVDDVEVDAKGNRYLVGTMWGSGNASASVDFDPGQGVALRTSVAGNAGQTAFVVKLDARGGLVWDREFSATNIGYGGLSVAVDSTGNVIIGGGFSGTADFDPGAGSVIRKSSFNPDAIGIPSTTHQDLFLLKLNSSGTYLWDRRIPLAPQAVAAVRCGLGVATNGAVYVAGEFAGTVDFDPGAGTSNLASTVGVTSGGAAFSTTDIYMLKLSPAGAFAWVRRVGGTANEEFGDLAVDSSNNVLVSGAFTGTVDFNPSPMNLLLSSPRPHGISLPGDFTLKLAADATFRFAVSSGDVAFNTHSNNIDTDAAGNVFLATSRAVDASTALETRLRKLSAIGATVWDERFSPVPPLGDESAVFPLALSVDGAGNPVMAFGFLGAVDLDPGAGSVVRNPAADASYHLAVTKINGRNGAYLWDRTSSVRGSDHFGGLAADAGGNVLFALNEFDGVADQTLLTQYNGPASFVGSAGDAWWAAANTGAGFDNRRLALWMPAGGLANVTTADVDGDGDGDVVGRAGDGSWWVGRNDGGTAMVGVRFLVSNAVMLDPQIGDLDGDGKADLVYRAPNTGMWVLLRSTGVAFANPEFLGAWNPAVAWTSVGLADVDADGDRDIVGRDPASGDWYVGRSSRAPGSTIATSVFGRFAPAVNWAHLTHCDWDGDGDADVVGRNPATGDWWLGRSDGASFTNVRVGATPIQAGWSDVQIADFDGDGDKDVIGRNANNGNWRLGRNDGGAELASLVIGNWAPGRWQFVTAADFDGDGRADLAGRRPETGEWQVSLSKDAGLVNAVWGSWATNTEWTNVRRVRL